MDSIAILPQYQGQGLVGVLVERLEADLRAAGYSFLPGHFAAYNGYADKIEKHYGGCVLYKQDHQALWGPQVYMKLALHDPAQNKLAGYQNQLPNIEAEQLRIRPETGLSVNSFAPYFGAKPRLEFKYGTNLDLEGLEELLKDKYLVLIEFIHPDEKEAHFGIVRALSDNSIFIYNW